MGGTSILNHVGDHGLEIRAGTCDTYDAKPASLKQFSRNLLAPILRSPDTLHAIPRPSSSCRAAQSCAFLLVACLLTLVTMTAANADILCAPSECLVVAMLNESPEWCRSWAYDLLPCGTLFHQKWWLSAATGNDLEEVSVSSGGRIVGRLPFKTVRHGPFRVLTMPEFTHVLGPVVDPGEGKSQAQLFRRVSIVNDLIDQLPPFDHFIQAFHPSMENLPAFQHRGFEISLQYTFRIDCPGGLDAAWAGMRDKTRNVVRRAEEKYSVERLDEAAEFVRFYNLEKRGIQNVFDFARFPSLHSECRTRQCGEILTARRSDGVSAAMVFLVWDDATMYYLLSSRIAGAEGSGAVSLLVWEGMRRAQQRGLTFDLDGTINSGTWRFLAGFGGLLATRYIVSRSKPLYRLYDHVRSWKNEMLGRRSASNEQ
jgi:hypothetical protein